MYFIVPDIVKASCVKSGMTAGMEGGGNRSAFLARIYSHVHT